MIHCIYFLRSLSVNVANFMVKFFTEKKYNKNAKAAQRFVF